MGLEPGQAVRDLGVSTVFLGSCTNGRIEDLREAASVLSGRKVADGVRMLIVPGSAAVRRQAVAEGLDGVFAAAGADFRPGAGCSMCCALNGGPARAGRTRRVHQQPQLRGAPGQAVPHAPRLAARRRRHRGRRPLHGSGGIVSSPAIRTGTAVPLRHDDVDTDQLAPARFVPYFRPEGYANILLADWRDDPDFVLNQPQYQGATFLVAGRDFGTGSSRESAVWACRARGSRSSSRAGSATSSGATPRRAGCGPSRTTTT